MTDQNLAPPDPVGEADDAVFFHLLDDARRPVITNLQVALDETGGGLAFPCDESDGIVILIISRRFQTRFGGKRRFSEEKTFLFCHSFFFGTAVPKS